MHKHHHRGPHKANMITNLSMGAFQLLYGVFSGDVLTASIGGHNVGDALTHNLRDEADSQIDPLKKRNLGLAAGASLVGVAVVISIIESAIPTHGTITGATQMFAAGDVGMNAANTAHTYYASETTSEQRAALQHNRFDTLFSVSALTSAIVAVNAKFSEFQSAFLSYGHLGAIGALGVYEMYQSHKEYQRTKLAAHYTDLPVFEHDDLSEHQH